MVSCSRRADRDWHYFNTPVEFLVKVAFGIMLGGACLAAIHDVEITFRGIMWMGANCITTAGYVLYMKFATNTVKLSKFGMVFYNNVLCIVFLLPVAVLRGEVGLFLDTPAIHAYGYIATNVFAGFIGFFLNFSSLHCVSVTGPTTYAILGSLNKIPVSILGYFLFDSMITGQTWFFIGVSMLGGFLYSYAKLDTGAQSPKESKRSADDTSSNGHEHHACTGSKDAISIPLLNHEGKSTSA